MGLQRTSTTTTIQMSGAVTVGELVDVLSDLPREASVRADHYSGGPMDPSYINLVVTH